MILASNSPRRRQLLALSGWDFSVQPADVDEHVLPGETPAAYVLRLAQDKVLRGVESSPGGDIVLAADTAVVDADAILGKPSSPDEAIAMLQGLRGHTHQVYTGIAVCRGQAGEPVTDLCVTDVPMRSYADEEIQAYVASGDPLDKAGAYGIQHPGFQPVEKPGGCFASVMGLPLCHVERSLRRLGLTPAADIPKNCQDSLDYRCPVWRDIQTSEPRG